jgi:hypothetical protein
MSSSLATTKLLVHHVYEIGIIATNILAMRNVQFSHHSTAKQLLQPFVTMLEQAKVSALKEKREYLKSCLVPDKDADKSHMFHVDGNIPPDESMQFCVLCSHEYVDLPGSKVTNHAANMHNREKYEQELEVYEKDKEAWKEKNKKGKPSEPKSLPVYFQCHCFQMSCSGYKQGTCEECNVNKPMP